MRGGPRAAAVWSCIESNGIIKVQCRECGLLMMVIPKRMRVHVKQCHSLEETGLPGSMQLESEVNLFI